MEKQRGLRSPNYLLLCVLAECMVNFYTSIRLEICDCRKTNKQWF